MGNESQNRETHEPETALAPNGNSVDVNAVHHGTLFRGRGRAYRFQFCRRKALPLGSLRRRQN
jgi:hypothetical protein